MEPLQKLSYEFPHSDVVSASTQLSFENLKQVQIGDRGLQLGFLQHKL